MEKVIKSIQKGSTARQIEDEIFLNLWIIYHSVHDHAYPIEPLEAGSLHYLSFLYSQPSQGLLSTYLPYLPTLPTLSTLPTLPTYLPTWNLQPPPSKSSAVVTCQLWAFTNQPDPVNSHISPTFTSSSVAFFPLTRHITTLPWGVTVVILFRFIPSKPSQQHTTHKIQNNYLPSSYRAFESTGIQSSSLNPSKA